MNFSHTSVVMKLIGSLELILECTKTKKSSGFLKQKIIIRNGGSIPKENSLK